MELAGLFNAPPGLLLNFDTVGPVPAHWSHPLPESIHDPSADSDGPYYATGVTTR